MPFTATWIDLEVIILSEVSHKDQYHISLICTNEPVYKTETDSQT